jgi:hypothetical protein
MDLEALALMRMHNKKSLDRVETYPTILSEIMPQARRFIENLNVAQKKTNKY